ncbi:unnamed protein product, partial [Urochloa humidicola]
AVILVYASPARRFTSAYESTRCDEYVLLRPGSGDLILLVYSTIRQAGGEHTGMNPYGHTLLNLGGSNIIQPRLMQESIRPWWNLFLCDA